MKGLLCFLATWIYMAIAVAQTNYIPYLNGNKWGYADSNGHVLIRPKWTSVTLFKGGRAIVNTDNSQAVIDTHGSYIIPPYRHWNGTLYTSVIGAFYNAKGKNGKYGIIDSNNHELLPCLYDKTNSGNGFTESGQFKWDKYYNKYVAKVCKDGKFGVIDTLNQTIIPFEHDGIDIDNIYPFSSPKYLVVLDNGKMGLINRYGRVMIPPLYRNVQLDEFNNNQVMIFKERTTVIADTNGKITWEIPGYTLGFPRHGHIPVQDSMGKCGIMNRKHELVIPCIYLGSWLSHDTIVVSRWSDSINNRDQQFRYYGINTYKPISGWLSYREYNKMPPQVAKQPQQVAQLPVAPQHKRLPHFIRLYIQGKGMLEYKKDSIFWAAIDYPKYPESFIPVKGLRQDDSTTMYAAVIDTNGNYVVPPQKTDNELRVLNTTDSLLLINTSDKKNYAVADFHLRPIMSFQSFPISAAFYHSNTFYAIDRHDSTYWVYWHSFEGGGSSEQHKYSYYLITKDGQPAEKLKNYKLLCMTDSNGYSIGTSRHRPDDNNEFDSTFCGYFMAEDNAGNKGIVGIDGHVQLPAVSFKYRQMSRIGANVFLVDNPVTYNNTLDNYYMQDQLAGNINTAHKHGLKRGLPYLVNSDNTVLLDSLTIETVGTITQEAAPLLYMVYLKCPSENPSNSIFFFMNNNGKAYYHKLPKWKYD